MKQFRFLIIVEAGDDNYSAYAPDLPGCVATGKTIEELDKNMHEAILLHLRDIIADKESIPNIRTTARYIDIDLSSAN